MLPAGASDAEGGGQGDLEVLPEDGPFLVGHDLLGLVVLLELFVLLLELNVGGVGIALLARRRILPL